ncbi:MAG: carboxypeptidase-like regulatory domain-containing protein [Bacteroidales bacterium]
MNKFGLMLIVLALVFSACKEELGEINGTVTATVNGVSMRVGKATVRIYGVKLADEGTISGDSGITPIEETTTDPEGNYMFDNITEGNYWITAVATIEEVKYGTSPYNPTGVYLPKGQVEQADLVISPLE